MAFKNGQEDPFHSGEVFHLWDYLYHTKNLLVTMQVLMNHTGDSDLKSYSEDLVESCFVEEAEQVEGILKEAGIRLPPAPPDRPDVEIEDIPAGARFNDNEIAFLLQKTLMEERKSSSYNIGIAQRDEIREMFAEFHAEQEDYERKLLQLAKDKGWLVLPPISIK